MSQVDTGKEIVYPVGADAITRLKRIEEESCSCDLLNGWTCGIHALVDEFIRWMLEEEPVRKVNR